MKTETVFTVSLPLSGGPLLLERTSFIPECEPGLFPEEEEETSSHEPSQFQPDLHGEDVGGCIPKKNLRVTLIQDMNHSPTEDLCYNQCGIQTATKYYEEPERNFNNPQIHQTFSTRWQNENDLRTPNHGWTTAAPYFPSSSHWQPSLRFKSEVEEYADRSFGVFQHYDQQQFSYQYAVTGWAASLPANVPYRPQGGFYDPAPHSENVSTHMQPQYGGNFSEHFSDVPETRGQLHPTEQGPKQTYQQFNCY